MANKKPANKVYRAEVIFSVEDGAGPDAILDFALVGNSDIKQFDVTNIEEHY